MIVSGPQPSLSALFSSGCSTLGGHLTLRRVWELEAYNCRILVGREGLLSTSPARIPGLTPIGQSAIKCPSTSSQSMPRRCSASSELCSDWLDQLTGVWPAQLRSVLLNVGETRLHWRVRLQKAGEDPGQRKVICEPRAVFILSD